MQTELAMKIPQRRNRPRQRYDAVAAADPVCRTCNAPKLRIMIHGRDVMRCSNPDCESNKGLDGHPSKPEQQT